MENQSQDKNTLKIIKLSNKSYIPKKATDGSAGMDLHACIDKEITISPGDLVKIPCGIAISVPMGYAAFVFARSGLGIKYGISLSNGVGVIDSDYRGEVCVGLCNLGKEEYTITPDERIAQLVILKVESPIVVEVDSLDETQRGTGGFGSTGK